MHCPNDECPDFVAFGVRGEYREGLLRHLSKRKALLRPGGPPTAPEPSVAEGRPLVAIASSRGSSTKQGWRSPFSRPRALSPSSPLTIAVALTPSWGLSQGASA